MYGHFGGVDVGFVRPVRSIFLGLLGYVGNAGFFSVAVVLVIVYIYGYID
jgi:hypothetical protein